MRLFQWLCSSPHVLFCSIPCTLYYCNICISVGFNILYIMIYNNVARPALLYILIFIGKGVIFMPFSLSHYFRFYLLPKWKLSKYTTYLYPTQRVAEGIMILTRPYGRQSVRQSCFLFWLVFFVSATPMKLRNINLWKFVAMLDILCRWFHEWDTIFTSAKRFWQWTSECFTNVTIILNRLYVSEYYQYSIMIFYPIAHY